MKSISYRIKDMTTKVSDLSRRPLIPVDASQTKVDLSMKSKILGASDNEEAIPV